MIARRSFLRFALVALAAAFIITGWVAAPAYTDAYYHFNAASRLASGQGLTDPYVWTYIGALDYLPMPSHLYWMPLTSLIAAVGMSLFGVGDYAAARLPFTLIFAAAALVAFWLGWRIGGSARHAWVAGLLTLFSGFFAKFWGAVDTFAPYALVGSFCLVFIGIALRRVPSNRSWLFWLISGALAALGHLTRADGLLLLIIAAAVLVWSWLRRATTARFAVPSLLALAIGYLLVMLPYFARNLSEIGTPLPLGGTQAIWFDEYNDIFSYPPHASQATLFADGLGAFVNSRREALTNNIGTFIAVEGWVIVTPLMLIGWWRRRRDSFLLPFALYALGLHLAMTFVFPFPGYRGGLLHSSAALIPFWAALGVLGLDDVVDWVARRRRRWNAKTAKRVFSGGLVAIAAALTVYIGVSGRVTGQMPALYAELRQRLPASARILSDDPPELYYYTGMGGAVLPNEPPAALLDIARRYQIDYLLLKNDTGSIPAPLLPLLDDPPDFLTPLPFESARLYAFQREPVQP